MDEIKFTDWIQALSSVIAMFVAIAALLISKRAMITGVKTQIRPISMHFNNKPEIRLYSTGPGIAYNVKVRFHTMKGMRTDAMVPGRIWYSDDIEDAHGSTDIQPNIETTFLLKINSIFVFNHLQPFSIEFELASGTKQKTYFKYLMGSRKEKIVKLTKFGVFKYKLNWIYMNVRHPIETLRARYALKKNTDDYEDN